jgi:hypothetical protein
MRHFSADGRTIAAHGVGASPLARPKVQFLRVRLDGCHRLELQLKVQKTQFD